MYSHLLDTVIIVQFYIVMNLTNYINAPYIGNFKSYT